MNNYRILLTGRGVIWIWSAYRRHEEHGRGKRVRNVHVYAFRYATPSQIYLRNPLCEGGVVYGDTLEATSAFELQMRCRPRRLRLLYGQLSLWRPSESEFFVSGSRWGGVEGKYKIGAWLVERANSLNRDALGYLSFFRDFAFTRTPVE